MRNVASHKFVGHPWGDALHCSRCGRMKDDPVHDDPAPEAPTPTLVEVVDPPFAAWLLDHPENIAREVAVEKYQSLLIAEVMRRIEAYAAIGIHLNSNSESKRQAVLDALMELVKGPPDENLTTPRKFNVRIDP